MKITLKKLDTIGGGLLLAAIVLYLYYLSTTPTFYEVREVTGWWLIEQAIIMSCAGGLICAIITSIMLYVSTYLHFKKKNNEYKHNGSNTAHEP